VIEKATRRLEDTPQSFIVGDFVLDVSSQIKEIEALRQNEYFARRWWELECLDYRSECELCLISMDDLNNRVKRKERILIDIRSFEKYQACHIKGSFQMDGPLVSQFSRTKLFCQIKQGQQEALDSLEEFSDEFLGDGDLDKIQTYIDFLELYHDNYPDNFIVLVGDKEDLGSNFGTSMLLSSKQAIERICVLKGGIDAARVENPEFLRKGSSNQTQRAMIAQFEKFVKKASAIKKKGLQEQGAKRDAAQLT